MKPASVTDDDPCNGIGPNSAGGYRSADLDFNERQTMVLNDRTHTTSMGSEVKIKDVMRAILESVLDYPSLFLNNKLTMNNFATMALTTTGTLQILW